MSNPNDPLGLFPEHRNVFVQASATGQNFGGSPPPGSQLTNIIVGVLIGVALLLGWQRFQQGGSVQPDGQRQEQRQSKSDSKTIVFIHELNPQSIDRSLLLREMHDFVAARKMQFRSFDDDLTDEPVPALIAYARTKGIDPPFMVLTDQADHPIKAARFPTTLDEVAKFVGR